MKEIVHHKIIDKSILSDGMTLPREVHAPIYDLLGKTLSRGDKESIKIQIDNQLFDASLKNLNNSATARLNDSLQLRWSVGNIGQKMRSLFPDAEFLFSHAESFVRFYKSHIISVLLIDLCLSVSH